MTDDARIAAIAKTIIMQGELGQGAYEHYDIDRIASLAAAITSAEFVAKHLPRAPRFPSPDSFLDAMIAQAPTDGLILEFGVFSGHSITRLANARPGRAIHGFDSFTGLPEFWRPASTPAPSRSKRCPACRTTSRSIPAGSTARCPASSTRIPGLSPSSTSNCDLYSYHPDHPDAAQRAVCGQAPSSPSTNT